MSNLRFPTLRKRRTREHIIADLSINHVERIALLCGFSVERIRSDYGIDLFIHTYHRRGEVENGRILVQVKASDRMKTASDGKSFPCRIDNADLLYWMGEREPVVLVQYDVKNDVAHWLHVQNDTEKHRLIQIAAVGKKITLAISRSDVFDRAALKEIARTKNKLIANGEGGFRHET